VNVDPKDLPTLNAILNGTAALLLVSGYVAIKRRKVTLHKACMGLSVVVSAVFLVSYLVYHYAAGSTRFSHEGWPRTVYLSILLTHTVLAATVPPLVIVTVWHAVKGRLDKHRRIARWTFPIWLYVSVTGVVIYLMLYVWFPAAPAA
jgi:uncharacterized membrane protein YozB (DUF420 family)